MKPICSILITGVLLAANAVAKAQSEWTLKLDKDGIKIYTKAVAGSPVKAVKAECELATSISSLTAVLLDVNSSKEWIYATKNVSLLQQTSPTEVIYYSEVDLPWPVSNRDFIVQFSVTQDSLTKTVKAISINKAGWLPPVKNVVRVEQSYSEWVITPVGNNRLHVEYELQVDPGGCLPAWLVNMFATTGPFYTFQKLKEQVKKPEYQHNEVAFIKN